MGSLRYLTISCIFLNLIGVIWCFAANDLIFPVSFGVVRYSSISVNFTAYMNNIGYPSLDDYGNNVGYNIISLDGFKTTTTFSSVINDLTPLGTWISVYSRILGNSRNIYGKSSSEIQLYIVNEFHKRGSKIVFNAFSFQRPVSQQLSNATQQASNIAQLVTAYNFDGVSIDFDDFNSIKQQTASSWLLTLLKTLRQQLGKDKLIILQLYPTFVKELSVFTNTVVNSYVDLFVLKYYNLLTQNYNTFEQIFTKANTYSGTSIWELQTNPSLKIDVCKTIVAKPPVLSATWNKDAFLSASSLNTFFDQARTKYSWYGGYANLDFASDPNAQFQLASLNLLRNYCNRYETCFCI